MPGETNAIGATSGNFSISASASASTVINGGGWTMVGLDFPSGVTGTGWAVYEGPSSSAVLPMYNESGSQVTVTTAAAVASSGGTVKLPPENYYAMRFCKLVASSAQSSAVVVKPIWARPLDG